ncbi:hypothetical protein SLPG_00056 [Salicola phage CGphi29]|uniref:hypothetical protein n=1 Tax=Salicola phage CGphi29 TaxID=754067 RepID=UPI0002C139D5|nr:hypothetical protein SLPG_00056 [Salicola phage CGphi29]AGH31850.1 hypothetical protein SLPG_00056 [Salicola phage CGphi29]
MSHKLRMEIARDFGEPFADVVYGFAQDGYSIGGTASVLEYPETSFRKFVAAKGWQHWFTAYGSDCANTRAALKEPNVTEAHKQAATRNAHKGGAKMAYMITYRGETMSLADHARKHGVNVKTARGRYKKHPQNLDYVFDPELQYNPVTRLKL